MGNNGHIARIVPKVALTFAFAFSLALIPACGGGGGSSASLSSVAEAAEGAAFNQPSEITMPNTSGVSGTVIDTSNVEQGYVCVAGESGARLKFQVSMDGETYNYDLPNDGSPTIYPINMGSGSYTFRIMQNVEGNNYVELDATSADVTLNDEFDPFLVPNMFCNYNPNSACVSKAREITGSATNVSEAVSAICLWVAGNVTYDKDKAERLSKGTGYVPDPDETLSTGKGICFDYASLSAAMLRSMGIPTKLVTGYVGQDNLYHAWIMVYIDGVWQSAQFSVDRNTWSRCDVTFASTGATKYTGDASAYTDKYTY